MNGGSAFLSGDATVVKRRRNNQTQTVPSNGVKESDSMAKNSVFLYSDASFLKWTFADAVHVATHHWMPCLFAFGLLFFMGVEYTLFMVPSSAPPFDLGFIVTRSLHRVLESSPQLNTLCAALNTVRRLPCLDLNLRFDFLRWFSLWVIEGWNLLGENANGLGSKFDFS